ncbi:NTP transferase domain-containing protein, partial [Candidatus Parcubacteria bacterium]|nr:NTP transferase domain-containing protein [Candidatus Parcubacteria bacterium]
IKSSFFYFKNEHPKQHLNGMDLLVFSTIPIAGGASSSSALVVASALAFRKINKIKIDLSEIAESSSKAEWFCGTRGGKMDHATMCFGTLDKALLINFKPFQVKSVSMPQGYSWVTFYTTKADKGNELTCQYNERSAVSRVIIPALLGQAQVKLPLILNQKTFNRVLATLPIQITLKEFAQKFPKEDEELKKMYPVLIKEKGENFALEVKNRAKHHLNEIQRTLQAEKLLKQGTFRAMQKLGKLLKETHLSLRDLYSVSSRDLEKVFKIANQEKGVLGARVMGGGFGGNLLVLVKSENTQELIEKVKKKYYLPQKRNSFEKDIMVSTAGRGAHLLPETTDLKIKLISKVNNWLNFDEKEIFSLVKEIKAPQKKIKVIVVAAGKGTRAKKSGLWGPKVLAPLKGKSALTYVLEKFSFGFEKPIIVVSPENEKEIKKALQGKNIEYVVQKKAQGTGDAVFQAMQKLKNFEGDIAVIWGKQALVKKETIKKTILLHRALGSSMSFPTTKKKNPYAPLLRDKEGWVKDSQETHLEEAQKIKFGEDNVGFFLLEAKALSLALKKIHEEIFDFKKNEYKTPKGEFGFPNLMVRKLCAQGKNVFAFCLANNFESKGINEKKDLKIMEKYL